MIEITAAEPTTGATWRFLHTDDGAALIAAMLDLGAASPSRWQRVAEALGRPAQECQRWGEAICLNAIGLVNDYPSSADLAARLRQLWYDYIATAIGDDDVWTTMSYGCAPGDDGSLVVEEGDMVERTALQLYHRVAAAHAIEGSDLIEVGCGRGGGAAFLARRRQPRSVVAVDACAQNLVHCRRLFPDLDNVRFRHGFADRIPCDDGCADFVVSVEAVHAFPSIIDFLREARRLLRPGGRLLLADFSFPAAMIQAESQLEDTGFGVVSFEAITLEVIKSLTVRDADVRERLSALPAGLAQAMRRFCGLKGSRMYEQLRQGELVYFCCAAERA